MKNKPLSRAKAGSRAKVASRAKAGSQVKPSVVSPPAREPGEAREVHLRRISKGKRPEFYDDPAVDQLFAVVTALAAELSVVFDRINTLEQVLTAAGALTADSIESYQPSPNAAADRAIRREAMIQRIFAVFETYAAPRER